MAHRYMFTHIVFVSVTVKNAFYEDYWRIVCFTRKWHFRVSTWNL